MAYQSSVTTSPLQGAVSNLRAFFGGVFSALGRAMLLQSAANARLERVERLRAKSDAELAELGITRDQIVHHVFRDLYYS